jgi:hypothetical protein
MHMEFGDSAGLFEWPEYSQRYVSYEEFDGSDLYELSFDAHSVLQIDPALVTEVWGRLSPSDQVAIVTAILEAHRKEMDDFEELWVDGSDVLALIRDHPGSSSEALEVAGMP